MAPPTPSSRRRRPSLNWQIQVVATILLGMTLSGCAISPKGGAEQGTLLTFTVTLNAPIPVNSPNIYAIVMNLGQGSATPQTPSSGTDIAPVIGTSTTGTGTSPNGIFSGLATNALIIQSVQNLGNPVGIYYFGATPVNTPPLGGPPGTTNPTGYTNDTLSSNGSDVGNVLTFNVYLSQLQPSNTQAYQWIRFQVLTMNTLSTSGAGGRIMDALGKSPNFTTSPWISLTRSYPYGLSQISLSGLTQDSTPGGDATLAIQNVTLNVSVP